jgi:hypothetical protein
LEHFTLQAPRGEFVIILAGSTKPSTKEKGSKNTMSQ